MIAPNSSCPIAPVVDMVFSRWTTPILLALNNNGRLRYGELERAVPGITAKVLTQRLRQMERDGLVIRTSRPGVPPRVDYQISDIGLRLPPLFAVIAEWGAANLPDIEQSRQDFDDDRFPNRHRDAVAVGAATLDRR